MKITYLLGAGASANALPLIKGNINSKADGLPDELSSFIFHNKNALLSKNKGWSKEDIHQLRGIANKCQEFGTPDLYAKFLLEKADYKTYDILKSLISIFFTHMQEVLECFDYRALTFLTTISENGKLPSSIKVISWNYDTQIEIAAKRLKPVLPMAGDMIRGFTCWPNTPDGELNNDLPFLLHLNGVAGATYSEGVICEKIQDHYNFQMYNGKHNLLSFAWEDDDFKDLETSFTKRRLLLANEMVKGTEILVIIGYSFPFFNRKLDQEIFKTMNSSLTKIYFQDPFYDGSQIRTKFLLSENINIEPVKQVENYHIPYEL